MTITLRWARKPLPPSEAFNRMRSILDGGPITPEERPPAGDMSPDEVEKLASKALQKLFRESNG
ncbi:MAG TPA: hypothetical protein VF179_02775 [Thermoanaerobaculia bacterium]|nr:hypothetical protein [Thermoanaerobaculia bacterium]